MSGTMPVNGSKLPWHRPTVGEFTHAEAIAKGIVSADYVDAIHRSNDPLAGLSRKQIFYRCIWVSDLSTCARVALLCIARFFDKDARGSSMSYQRVARDCGFDESTAKREVKRARGTWLHVEVGKGTARSEGRENLYHGICPPDLVERLRESELLKAGVSGRHPLPAEHDEQGSHPDTSGAKQGCQGDTGYQGEPQGVSQGHTESRSPLDRSRSSSSSIDDRKRQPAAIHKFVSEHALDRVRTIAPCWDRQALLRKFVDWPDSKNARDMDAAFLGWVAKFTKGRAPP